MMKILVASDIHGSVEAVEKIRSGSREWKVELVVICGDITHFGNANQAQMLLRGLSTPSVPVLFIPGNCDSPDLATLQDLGEIHNLHERTRVIEGICFGGVGGAPPTPFDTPFELSEERIRESLDLISPGLTTCPRSVLVTHSPPVDTSLDLTRFRLHAGSRSVRGFIEERQPALVLCGHVHESKGKDTLGRSLMVNPGSVRNGPYAVVNFAEETEVVFADS